MFEIFGFLVGVHLTMTLFGSCYRIIDLAYRFSDFWLDVTSRICLNVGIIFLIYVLMTGPFVTGFFTGQVFFCIFHISVFWIGQLAVRLLRKS